MAAASLEEELPVLRRSYMRRGMPSVLWHTQQDGSRVFTGPEEAGADDLVECDRYGQVASVESPMSPVPATGMAAVGDIWIMPMIREES